MSNLIELARNKTNGLLAEFSTSILTNLSNNGDCRSEMYKLHLKQCSSALGKWHKETNSLPSLVNREESQRGEPERKTRKVSWKG